MEPVIVVTEEASIVPEFAESNKIRVLALIVVSVISIDSDPRPPII